MQNSDYLDLRRELRKNATRAEKVIWPHLRLFRWKGYPVRRQFSIDPYIVDFYCPKAKLAIEIDGDIHLTDYQKGYDKTRDEFIRTQGIEVIRYTNCQIYDDIDSVLQTIEQKILRKIKSLPPN